ncbi:DinB family protein [Bradyrhizobium sp.]|uniref:DinB family protein n=1 Tax=Bradyrhizobium sp. TaxID=376 RepID=UPI003C3A60C4
MPALEPPSADDLALPYRAMAYNDAWCNHRLLAACTQLSQAEFEKRRTGFFPSLRATLNHILVVDRFYVDAMEGGDLGPAAWSDPEPCGTVALLRQAQAEIDRRLLAVVRKLDGPALQRVVLVHRENRVQQERLDRLLLHLFQHQVHHRGQAHAMMSGTPVAPPQLNELFCAGEAHLRADEFAALGWTEDAIWFATG